MSNMTIACPLGREGYVRRENPSALASEARRRGDDKRKDATIRKMGAPASHHE